MTRVFVAALLLLAGCPNRFECDEETPCAFGSTCIAGQCEEVSCATSEQCPMEHYCDATRSCVEGCKENSDCLAGSECDKEADVCVPSECQNTSTDCGYKEYCNSATGDCYEAGGDFCKPCEPQDDECGSGNICWAGYCGVNCEGGRECPSGFECAPFVDDVGNIVTYQCITYCWLFEGYAPGTFVSAPGPDLKGPFQLETP